MWLMCKSYQQTLVRICNDSVAVISCLDHAQFLSLTKYLFLLSMSHFMALNESAAVSLTKIKMHQMR